MSLKDPSTYKDGYPVGRGWWKLIGHLIETLKPYEYEITQIKEKFGGLRFYTTPLPEQANKIISLAEDESYKICEKCGIRGKLREDLPWIKTLCDYHYKKKLDELEERRKKWHNNT